jgi:chorismate mutase
MDDIAKWRKKIDELDLELVKLLNQRSDCAIEIGKLKHKLDIEIYDPRREEEVIGRVWKEANGPLSKDAVKRLFERIIDESRRAERESSGPEDPERTQDQQTAKKIEKE